MKNLYLFLLSTLIITSVNAQWITSISVHPSQPTTADTIIIIIENTFPSGPCEGTTTLTGISGTSITAQGMHCIGMLTVICTDFDTLVIPPQTLQAGSYSFAYTLETGSGFPCTFGGIPSVNDSVLLTVSLATAVNEITDNAFGIFPNPSNGKFILRQNDGQASNVKIYSVAGQIIYNLPLNTIETEVSCTLPPGLYVLLREVKGMIRYYKIVVEE